MAPQANSLPGRRIAVPAHAELDHLEAVLRSAGATVTRFPLMSILPAADTGPVHAWLRALAAGGFDEVVFLTGQGLTHLVEAASSLGLLDDVLAALSSTRKITRGPKPARILYDLGLSVEIAAASATMPGVIDCFRGRVLTGRRIGVQLFGDNDSDVLVRYLAAKGALVHAVAPYRYEAASSAEEVTALIEEIAADHFAAVVFTTAMQVERLFEVALLKGIESLLRVGLAGAQVAALGRETAAALASHEVAVDLQPPRQFWISHLVHALIARLGTTASPAVVTQS